MRTFRMWDKVGRTPWSARVPLDPLFAELNQPHAIPERPTGGPAADQGDSPTICAEWSLGATVSDIGLPGNADMWDRPPGLSFRLTPRSNF
jgi:hypothetical protein